MCCIFKTTHSNTYKSGNDIKGYNVLFCFFYYRAAWWIQGRPRTRLWCQRWQEPRSNLLKDTHSTDCSLNCIASRSSPHQDGLFVTYSSFFFFYLSRRLFHFPNWHITICFVFWRGPGFGFLSSEYHSRDSEFLTFTPSVPLGQAVVVVNLYGFFSLIKKNTVLCIFVEQKTAKL